MSPSVILDALLKQFDGLTDLSRAVIVIRHMHVVGVVVINQHLRGVAINN